MARDHTSAPTGGPNGVTMHDVAARAGVSQATVSLVLNGRGGSRVAEATRDRVLAAVKELGYHTNAFAKSLRSGESGMIGFVSDEVATAPFAGKMLKGAQHRAWTNNLVILSVDTFGESDLEHAAIEMMLSYRVSGIVYASMYHRHVTVPEALRHIPTVVANAQESTGQYSAVFPDEEQGGYEATQVLTADGHRRVAFINIQDPASDLPAGIGRMNGYRRALSDAGIAFDPALVRYGLGVVGDGHRLTRELLALTDPPTAVFCGNDRTAWGAYRAMDDLGLRVGVDVSLVGFDNQDSIAPDLNPGLTTMALPFEAMGSQAIDLLLDRPRSPQQHPQRCTLVSRGSVLPAKVPA